MTYVLFFDENMAIVDRVYAVDNHIKMAGILRDSGHIIAVWGVWEGL